MRAYVRIIVDYSRLAVDQAANARQESSLPLSTPRRFYAARLLDAKAKERCDKAVTRPRNMAALTHAYL